MVSSVLYMAVLYHMWRVRAPTVCYTEATMHIQVYFTPADLRAVAASAEDIYIVIDMIRATTTLPVTFERGAARVFVVGSVEQARAAREKHPERLLCGERNAQPSPPVLITVTRPSNSRGPILAGAN